MFYQYLSVKTMMEQFVDINNRKQLNSLLLTLDTGAIPLWGKMKPRQMIEHLVASIEYTNGKKITTCNRPPEDANKDKEIWIYTDARIPKNIILGPLPKDFKYADMQTAIKQLMKELDDFDQYFKESGITSVHSGFGPMNHQEWLIWHSKHFIHHLKQFRLLPE
jgi:hypothetical protein